jgi:L-threonylcarbamoyladenylate synthase
MQTQVLPIDHPQATDSALAQLKSGNLVAFPTDTVYGLGAMAFNAQAVDKLFFTKGRDSAKAIAVLVGNKADLSRVADQFGGMALRLAEHFWPGPLTLVVFRHAELPSNLSPTRTIGVRMPDHPSALVLLNNTGPLAVTSANLSNQPNANTAEEVLKQLDGRIPLVLNGGRTPGGSPSTVVDCTKTEPVILREGPISLEHLEFALS